MSTVPGYPGYPGDPQQQGGAQPGGYQQGGYQQGGYPSGGFQQPSGYPSGGFQQPGYGQQPPGYGQPPPGYGQQPPAYGYPQPQYAAGYPGYGQPVKSGRPGMVTAAAVLAFVWGGLAILWSIFALLAGSIISAASSAVCDTSSIYYDSDSASACDAVSGVGGFLIAITIGLIVVAALLIAGGVTAINGKNGQILVLACALYAVLAIVGLIVSGAFGFSYLLGIVVPVLIVVFMLNSSSRAWFRSVGGRTF